MKFRVIAAVFSLCAVMLSGCMISVNGAYGGSVRGRGAYVGRDYDVEEFTNIDIRGGFELIYRAEDSGVVKLEMYENLFDYAEVSSRGGTLYIATRRNIAGKHTPRAYVSAQTIERLTVSGAVMMSDADAIETDSLRIDIEGACHLDISVETRDITVYTAGAGSIVLGGAAETLKLTNDGVGRVDASRLETDDARVVINGVGSVEVNCLTSLDAEINGLGSLKYWGNPSVSKRVYGLGAITKA